MPSHAEERAWLVFRLGPHVMCASALDVEGIIEPVRPRPVPFSPPYMLGWFDFRGKVASVISLRRKFGVRAGEDSSAGPYIVARVQGDLAAFWVDEVRDVLEAHQADWQPMPEMPGASAFADYTLQDGEVILRSSFSNVVRRITSPSRTV
jgi:purine-binding chemotaxis protein CheW